MDVGEFGVRAPYRTHGSNGNLHTQEAERSHRQSSLGATRPACAQYRRHEHDDQYRAHQNDRSMQHLNDQET